MLRSQMGHFMTVAVNVTLQKFDAHLREHYGWIDPKEGNVPGPFMYREYLHYVLFKDSWEDQVVHKRMSVLW